MKNRINSLLAACGLFVVFFGSTAVVSAQAANWCKWDERNLECNWTANDGLCAVSGTNCDVPVVE
ncbi:MAG: hypothetical protein ACK4SF_06060 [Algoriphagus aquaeductus]|uniref:hypothetical protein n=1 Tax=Algoriphagus aquaeductus TaxID=475299 RepID=UPI003919B825